MSSKWKDLPLFQRCKQHDWRTQQMKSAIRMRMANAEKNECNQKIYSSWMANVRAYAAHGPGTLMKNAKVKIAMKISLK